MEKLNNNCYEFRLNEIGPAIATLLTRVEGRNYHYQSAYYHGEDYYVGHYGLEANYLNGICLIITEDNKRVIREDGNVDNFCQKEDAICLATIHFQLPPIFHNMKFYWTPKVDNMDDSIEFFNDTGDSILFFEKYPYIYDFIDFVISRKVFELKDGLSIDEYDELIDEFVRERQKEVGLIRRKGDKNGK